MKKILTALIFLILLAATPAFSQVIGLNPQQNTYAEASAPSGQTSVSDGSHGGITTTPVITPASSLVNTNIPPVWTYSVGAIFMSTYYGTYFGGTFYDGPMSFWDITAVRKDRFGNSIICFSVGQKLDRLNKFNQDGGNEYDLSYDHTFKLNSSKSFPISLDVGVCYLAMTDLNDFGNDAFDETARLDMPLFADRTNVPANLYAQIFHYHTVDGMRDEGWLGFFGVNRDQNLGIKLFNNDLKLNIEYRCGVNFAVFGSHAGIEYHRLAFSLPIKKGGWTITPSIIGQTPGGSGMTYVSKNEVFGTLSIRYSF